MSFARAFLVFVTETMFNQPSCSRNNYKSTLTCRKTFARSMELVLISLVTTSHVSTVVWNYRTASAVRNATALRTRMIFIMEFATARIAWAVEKAWSVRTVARSAILTVRNVEALHYAMSANCISAPLVKISSPVSAARSIFSAQIALRRKAFNAATVPSCTAKIVSNTTMDRSSAKCAKSSSALTALPSLVAWDVKQQFARIVERKS